MIHEVSAGEINKIVILGHTGFVGNRLMGYFRDTHPNLKLIGLSSKDIDLTDSHAASELAPHFEMNSAVIMCSGIKSNYGNDLETYAKNVRMAENVARVLLNHPVKRFIFFSSIAVYGVYKHNRHITEKTPLLLDTYYGLSKHVCEQVLNLVFSTMPDNPLVILRLPTIYGPYEKIRVDTPSGFMTTYLAGGEVTLYGDGSELREFLFIEDLVKVVAELCFVDFAGVLNVSSGVPHSYRESLDIISGILGRELNILFASRTRRKVDKVYRVGFFRSIFPEFRFTPLEEGLRIIKDAQGNQTSPQESNMQVVRRQ